MHEIPGGVTGLLRIYKNVILFSLVIVTWRKCDRRSKFYCFLVLNCMNKADTNAQIDFNVVLNLFIHDWDRIFH
jgi:hypothetical protein